jgi:hypothetical protein
MTGKCGANSFYSFPTPMDLTEFHPAYTCKSTKSLKINLTASKFKIIPSVRPNSTDSEHL